MYINNTYLIEIVVQDFISFFLHTKRERDLRETLYIAIYHTQGFLRQALLSAI